MVAFNAAMGPLGALTRRPTTAPKDALTRGSVQPFNAAMGPLVALNATMGPSGAPNTVVPPRAVGRFPGVLATPDG
ncbi:hypothetical protein JD82_02337 [Prauserella rugosa]|uniref:Uncharacterized protein n=1 Tax=Prauserella rugosa TaxID=43354 RepID=A0A660CHI0_9PSEU|nr:hypothetical protein JD82_02337 [Prauserella rugosa]